SGDLRRGRFRPITWGCYNVEARTNRSAYADDPAAVVLDRGRRIAARLLVRMLGGDGGTGIAGRDNAMGGGKCSRASGRGRVWSGGRHEVRRRPHDEIAAERAYSIEQGRP